MLAENLFDNHKDFKRLYNRHYDELIQVINELETRQGTSDLSIDNDKDPSTQMFSTGRSDQNPFNRTEDINSSRNVTQIKDSVSKIDLSNKIDEPLIGMVYIQDKKTQKPLWVSNRTENLDKFIKSQQYDNSD